MARYTKDREDLLRDGVNFERRVKFLFPAEERSLEVFAGFRLNGSLSIYFGADPVYQFNSQKELRRAFVDDHVIKAEQGQLIRWSRQHSEGKVEMLRFPLSESELAVFTSSALKRLFVLRNCLQMKQETVLGQIPEGTNVILELEEWLSGLDTLSIANSPRVA